MQTNIRGRLQGGDDWALNHRSILRNRKSATYRKAHLPSFMALLLTEAHKIGHLNFTAPLAPQNHVKMAFFSKS